MLFLGHGRPWSAPRPSFWPSACWPAPARPSPPQPRKIRVVYVFHGGTDASGQRSSWESTLQIFSYDPNSVVYNNVIWNLDAWPRIPGFGNAPREPGKYAFEYERIGGTDPAQRLTLAHYEALARIPPPTEPVAPVDLGVMR